MPGQAIRRPDHRLKPIRLGVAVGLSFVLVTGLVYALILIAGDDLSNQVLNSATHTVHQGPIGTAEDSIFKAPSFMDFLVICLVFFCLGWLMGCAVALVYNMLVRPRRQEP